MPNNVLGLFWVVDRPDPTKVRSGVYSGRRIVKILGNVAAA